jgi:hypothetical protein
MTTIHIEARNVFGQWKLYPVNDAAKALAAIAGTKTLDPRDIKTATTVLGMTLIVSADFPRHLFATLNGAES